MNNRNSEAIVDKISFVELQPSDISPFVSKCHIKVCYVGQNRNGSAIDKQTLTNMSKTLRGCPIVGHYKEEKEDFGDHGDQLIIDGDGATFNCLTKPYGFVSLDAKVWFQFFEDTDEFGNIAVREYLMTEGFLWTHQYPEAQRVIDEQNPQSMEIDDETLKGHWATDNNSGLEFFIINDAIFSKLCILGEDVEPCFEGAQFLKPEIESTFTKNSDFVKEFTTMVKELHYALKNDKGGLLMNEQNNSTLEVDKSLVENSLSEQGNNNELNSLENDTNIENDFVKKEEEKTPQNKEEDKGNNDSSNKKEEDKNAPQEENKENNNDKEKENKKKSSTKNSLEVEDLQTKLNELQEKFSLLEKENKELLAFKNKVEDEQKDELIKSFYMLSDEDKKDIIENKAKYSLSDIKKELSVICFDKKVNFNLGNEKQEKEPATIFNLKESQTNDIPTWLQAVENVKNRK